MKQCQQRHYTDMFLGKTARCQNVASERLWCPTWVSAIDGPMDLCFHCAKNFKLEFNPHATGEFYWGEQADVKFKEIGGSRATTFKV